MRMYQLSRAVCLILIVFFVSMNYKDSYAEIIFSENFDNQTNWQPTNKTSSHDINGYTGGGEVDGTPTGWTAWRNDEYWIPSETTGSQPSIRIAPVTSGKALICTNESENDSPDGGGGPFASDGILLKDLGNIYTDLYIRYDFKSQLNFNRHWITGFNLMMIKQFRALRHHDGASYFNFFDETGESNDLFFIPDIQEDEYSLTNGPFFNLFARCIPWTPNYFCDENYTSHATSVDVNGDNITGWTDSGGGIDQTNLGMFDGGAHRLIFRIKLNSSPGTKDGIYQLYYDGFLIASVTDIQWVGPTGSMTGAGWNVIAFGGNVYNNYLNITNGVYQDASEQYYEIDNIVAATSLQEAIDGPATPVYDAPTITGPDDFSTTSTSVEIEGPHTVDPDIADQSVVVTWTLGENSGFCVAVFGVFSCTVPVGLGANNIVFEITDSNSGTDSDTTVVTRTVPPSGNFIYTGSMSGGSYR